MLFRTVVALIAAAMLFAFLSPILVKLHVVPLYAVIGIGFAMMLWEQWETIRDDEH